MRIERARRWATDVVVVVVVGAAQLVGTYFAGRHDGAHAGAPSAGGLALLAVAALALVARRRWPAGVLVVTFAATMGSALVDHARGPIFLALVVAFVTAVRAGRRLVSYLVLAAGYAGFLFLADFFGSDPGAGPILGLAAWLLVLAAVAEISRYRRERAVAAAHGHAEEARRRASEERLRISRELHDVLGHHLSLISVQSGVALHLADAQPEQARAALRAVNAASKEALGELRSVLAVFRDTGEQPPRSPAPSLARLPDLIARSQDAGLRIDVQQTGAARPLPASIEAASYRIVQEALTNVTRHAGPAATATVRLDFGEHDLCLQVDDDGRARPGGSPTAGHGLAGMRERVGALGGDFEAGPRPGGGFRVAARLPLNGS